MVKIISAIFLSLAFIFTVIPETVLHPTSSFTAAEEEDEPSYAKWGRMAMKETKDRYSNADIIDYLYVGKEITGERTTETFKLWLRDGTKEFGVYVAISFDSETEQNITWKFTETDR